MPKNAKNKNDKLKKGIFRILMSANECKRHFLIHKAKFFYFQGSLVMAPTFFKHIMPIKNLLFLL